VACLVAEIVAVIFFRAIFDPSKTKFCERLLERAVLPIHLLDERGFHRGKRIQKIRNGLDGFFRCWSHATSRICYINFWGGCQARIFI